MTLLLLACTDPVTDDTSAPTDDSSGIVDDTGDTDQPVDADGDGVFSDEDCDDEDASIYPGATEVCDGKNTGCADDWEGDAGLVTWDGDDDWSEAFAEGGAFTLDQPGTLRVCEGEWPVELFVEAEVTIEGPEDDVVLDGMNGWTPVTADDPDAVLTLRGLEIVNGEASNLVPDEGFTGGGGLFCHEATLTLEEVVIEDSNAILGGGLFAQDCDLTIDDARVDDNTASSGGGAWLAWTTIEAIDFWLEGNVATQIGGGLGLYEVEGAMDDLHLAFNTAEAGGGASLQGDTRLSLTNAYAAEHSATVGSAMYLDGELELSFEGGKIKKNEASSAGGGLYSTGNATLVAQGTEFSENVAPDGGAVWLYTDTVTLDDVVMDENEATRGAAGWLQGTTATLSASRVRLNIAEVGGGFRLASPAVLSIVATDFSGNTPDDVQCAAGDSYTLGEAATTTCDGSSCE